jgi:threonine 3-dehydrogenase
MGHYYKTMYNIDFRCLRYNSLISPDDNQFNGCTDYASEIFIKADKNQQYPIALSKHRKISFSYIDDIVNATLKVVDTPKEKLTQTTYNLNCVTCTPEEYVAEMEKYYDHLMYTYKPDLRDIITKSWPHKFSDYHLESDVGFTTQYNTVERIVSKMYEERIKIRKFDKERYKMRFNNLKVI